MAKTYPKRPLVAGSPDDPYLGYVTRHLEEAASQTYPAGSPVKDNGSGYVAVFVNPTDAKLLGFSITAGNDDAADGTSKAQVILATGNLTWYATFLGSAAADNVFAQTDLHVAFDIASGANLLGTGVAGWYLQDSTSDPVLRPISPRADYVFPDVDNSLAVAGDTNVRLACRQLLGSGLFI